MNATAAHTIWSSGVTRWHANRNPRLRYSGDCTDAHSARCARLLLCLNPEASADLIAAVLHHDVAESYTGDVPWQAKQNETLRDVLHWLESELEASLGLATPRHAQDVAWIKLVDRLDAWLWVMRHDRDEASNPEWQDAEDRLRRDAWSLGVGAEVEGIMQEASK